MALSEKLTAHTDPVLGSKQEDDNRGGGVSRVTAPRKFCVQKRELEE